jgi:hypothetical protein
MWTHCVWGFSQDWANFYLASNGEIMREPTFQSSADVWATPTTPFVSAPAVASWGNQRYDLFAYDRNGHLGHLAQSTRSGSVSWDDWGASPAGSFEFKPTVTSWGNSRLDLFATTGAGFVYHLSFDNGTKSGWTNLPALPGEISPASAPAATSGFWSTTSSNPELDVFVAGADGNLYHSTSSDGTTFSGWVSIGQPGGGVTLKGNPAAASWGPNAIPPATPTGLRLDVFMVNSASSVSHAYMTGTTTTWETWAAPIGFPLTGDPAATAMGDQRLFVGGVTASGDFVEYWWDSGLFLLQSGINHAFSPVGTATAVAPTPTYWP